MCFQKVGYLLFALITNLLLSGQYGNCNRIIGHNHIHNKSHTHHLATKRLNQSGFVQRSGIHFILNGKSLYLNGFNSYFLMNIATDPSTKSKVTTIFQETSKHGLNLARTWAFNDGDYKPLQISPGTYDEDVFKVYTNLLHFIL